MRGTVLGALAALGADQLADLHLHQLPSQPLHRLAQHVGVLVDQHLPGSIAILSAPAIAGASLSSNREKSDEHEHRGGRNHNRSVRPAFKEMKVKLPGAFGLLVGRCGVGAGD
jgi:hypothetical protein